MAVHSVHIPYQIMRCQIASNSIFLNLYGLSIHCSSILAIKIRSKPFPHTTKREKFLCRIYEAFQLKIDLILSMENIGIHRALSKFSPFLTTTLLWLQFFFHVCLNRLSCISCIFFRVFICLTLENNFEGAYLLL